ncbi:MAG: hypothetical protein SH848_14995 [Saprospiraceae bacterium]|nr:hypothetical protein [Saprospiraceae bacterium]MDZ4705232.1 hypothetical protein [Saprospiraceae bacterium]
MKKLFLLLAFSGAVGFAANAQCSGSKSASTDASIETPGAHCAAAAAKLASLDASIETRTCPQTGKVSYMKKNVSAENGKATFMEVEYCSKSGKFINVSPSEKAACTKSKAGCSGDAKATKVSSAGGAGCCAGAKAASASCCDKSKSSSASSIGTTKKAATAKLVSNQE